MFPFATLDVAVATCGLLSAIWWMSEEPESISDYFSERESATWPEAARVGGTGLEYTKSILQASLRRDEPIPKLDSVNFL